MAKMKVFLSYSSADRLIAERIHTALEAAGYEVFFDRDSLPAGESFDVRIVEALEQSDLLIFLLSPTSIKAGAYTLTELGFARRQWSNPSGRVLPVVVQETDLDALPAYLRPVTLLEPDGDVVAEVVAAVHLLSRRGRRRATRIVVALAVTAIVVGIAYYYTFQMREYECRLVATNASAFAKRMIDYADSKAERERDILEDLRDLSNELSRTRLENRGDWYLDIDGDKKEIQIESRYFQKEASLERRLSSIVKKNNTLMTKLEKDYDQHRAAIFARCLDGSDASSRPELDFSLDTGEKRFKDFVKLAKQLEELAARATGEVDEPRITRQTGPEVLESSKSRVPQVPEPGLTKNHHQVVRQLLTEPEMVRVTEGTFLMGSSKNDEEASDDEFPPHKVEFIRPFAIGKYEVTFEEYDQFASATRRWLPNHFSWGHGKRPVMDVSWHDAKAYADWLSDQTGKKFRLPTEAEWEYAARAGTQTRYWWGDEVGQNRANCDGCGSEWDKSQTAPVGSFEANPFELHDTLGNVMEWVQDCFHDDYENAPVDGSAWLETNCARRVIRGGSWKGGPGYVRSAYRFRNFAGLRFSSVGFRLAQDID